jgi:hypothetical protein
MLVGYFLILKQSMPCKISRYLSQGHKFSAQFFGLARVAGVARKLVRVVRLAGALKVILKIVPNDKNLLGNKKL